MSTHVPDPPAPGIMHQASVPGAANLVLTQGLLDRLNNYAAAMQVGRPIDGPQAAIHQGYLWQTIKWVLGKERGEFTLLFTELLNFIHTHRNGMFDPRYAFRAFDQLKMSAPERRNFERFMHLLIRTSDPGMRRLALQQVDLRSTLAGFTDNQMQQRVVGYYQV